MTSSPRASAFSACTAALARHTLGVLLIGAFVLIQCLLGGTTADLSLPTYALLAVAAVLAAVSRAPFVRSPDFQCLLGSAIFFPYILARAAVSPFEYFARPDLFMVLACLVVYLLAAFRIVETQARLHFIAALLCVAVVEFAVAVVQSSGNEEFMLFGFARPAGSGRASGMFINPNHFAGYMEAVGMIGLNLVWWGALRPWIKVATGYITLCCFAGLVLSGSRGGYISTAFALLVWIGFTLHVTRLKNPSAMNRAMIASACGVAALFLAAGWLMTHREEINQRFDQRVEKDIRTANWQAALDQHRLAPAFGTGAGTHFYYGRLFRRPELQVDPIHAHNDYLELLGEYGLVGAVGFFGFLFAHLANAVRTVTRHARDQTQRTSAGDNRLAIDMGCISAVAALAAHSVVDFNMHIPGNALMFAFIFGVIANADDAVLAMNPGRIRETAVRAVLITLAILIAVFALPKWPGAYFTERARIAVDDAANAGAGIAAAKRAIQWDGKNPDAYFHLGEAWREKADDAEEDGNDGLRDEALRSAVAAFENALRFSPHDENILIRLAQTYDSLREFDRAEECFKHAIAWDPKLAVLQELYREHQRARAAPAKPREEKPTRGN